MPHAGHFICGAWCRFRLNTYVNGYIVSTVGEYVPAGKPESASFEAIGLDRLYETMVFKAEQSTHACCPFQQTNGDNLDFRGYNDAGAAYKGHLAMVKKWQAQRAR